MSVQSLFSESASEARPFDFSLFGSSRNGIQRKHPRHITRALIELRRLGAQMGHWGGGLGGVMGVFAHVWTALGGALEGHTIPPLANREGMYPGSHLYPDMAQRRRSIFVDTQVALVHAGGMGTLEEFLEAPVICGIPALVTAPGGHWDHIEGLHQALCAANGVAHPIHFVRGPKKAARAAAQLARAYVPDPERLSRPVPRPEYREIDGERAAVVTLRDHKSVLAWATAVTGGQLGFEKSEIVAIDPHEYYARFLRPWLHVARKHGMVSERDLHRTVVVPRDDPELIARAVRAHSRPKKSAAKDWEGDRVALWAAADEVLIDRAGLSSEEIAFRTRLPTPMVAAVRYHMEARAPWSGPWPPELRAV